MNILKTYMTVVGEEYVPYAVGISEGAGETILTTSQIISRMPGQLGAIRFVYSNGFSIPVATFNNQGVTLPLFMTTDIVIIPYSVELQQILIAEQQMLQGASPVDYSVGMQYISQRIMELKRASQATVKEEPKVETQPTLQEEPQSEPTPKVEETPQTTEPEVETTQQTVEQKSTPSEVASQDEEPKEQEKKQEEVVKAVAFGVAEVQQTQTPDFKVIVASEEGGKIINKGTPNEEFIPRVIYHTDYPFTKSDTTLTMKEKLLELLDYAKTDDLSVFNDNELYEQVANHFLHGLDINPRVVWDALTPEIFLTMCKVEILDKSPNRLYESMYPIIYHYYCGMKAQQMFEGVSYTQNRMYTSLLTRLLKFSSRAEQRVVYEDETNEDNDTVSVIFKVDEVKRTSTSVSNFLIDSVLTVDLEDAEGNAVGSNLERVKVFCRRGRLNKPTLIEHDMFLAAFGVKSISLILKETDIILALGDVKLSPHAIGDLFSKYNVNVSTYKTDHGITSRDNSMVPLNAKSIGLDYNESLEQLKMDSQFQKDCISIMNFVPIDVCKEMNLVPKALLLPVYTNQPKSNKPIGIIFEDLNAIVKSKSQIFIPILGTYFEELEKYGVTVDGGLKFKKVRSDYQMSDGSTQNIYIMDVNYYADRIPIKKFNHVLISDISDINSEKLQSLFNRTTEQINVPSFVKQHDVHTQNLFQATKFIPSK